MSRATRRRRHPRKQTAPTSGPPVLLAYARDGDGARVDVAELDPGRRKARAPFTCLGCGEELLPHLGRVRARHFAHRPGSICPLTKPESALHFNAKLRLLELCRLAFSGARQVILAARCPHCRRQAPQDLARMGDAALLEGGAGKVRADVLVTRGGDPSLALEVRVTHRLEEEKERALAALAIPAVEIDARDPWESEQSGAVLIACQRSLGFAECPSCQAEARATLGRSAGGEEAALAELEAYRARGLLGPRPGPLLPEAPPLSEGERRSLTARFVCAHCGGTDLEIGRWTARHACDGRPLRAVAWKGYDGALVVLEWWSRR